MRKSKRLQPLVEMAQSQEERAARALGESQRKRRLVLKNLHNLKAFREDYTVRFKQTGRQGIGAAQLTDYRIFLHKLNQAVGEQEKALQQMEQALDSHQKAWEAARSHARGLQKLLEAALNEELMQQQKHEQMETDQRAGRGSKNNKRGLLRFSEEGEDFV